uniref:Protein phosphatase 1 regulatory subunit 1B n=1 Tax=Globodera pallida TaxID=36090 RepID=A0A183BUM3_GLOPA
MGENAEKQLRDQNMIEEQIETAKDDELEMFKSPQNTDDSSDTSGLLEAIPEKELIATAGFTPAINKLRKSRMEFKVFSPSDQLISPCTRKIEKSRMAGVFSQPQVFRTRHPLVPSQAMGSAACTTVGSSRVRNDGTVAPACTPQRLQLDGDDEEEAETEQKQQQQQQQALVAAAEDETGKESSD